MNSLLFITPGDNLFSHFLVFNLLISFRSRQDSQSSGRPQSAGRGHPAQPVAFHRGAGRGGALPTRGMVHQGQRGRGRGSFQPGKFGPTKEKLTFDSEYDFDKANEEFQEVLNKLNKTKLDDTTASATETGDMVEEGVERVEPEEGEIQVCDHCLLNLIGWSHFSPNCLFEMIIFNCLPLFLVN